MNHELGKQNMSTLLIQLMIISLLFVIVRPAAITRPNTRAEEFLRQFGYITDNESHRRNSKTAQTFSEAITRFQTFNGLKVTGELDRATVAKMNAGRCGNPDFPGTDNVLNGKYVLSGSTWKKLQLTYKITKYTSNLTKRQVDNEIYEASKLWSDASNITFQQVSPEYEADIEIKFVTGNHGDGFPFNRADQTLAHAFQPIAGGDIHFNKAKKWSFDKKDGEFNLRMVAAHEFGHSLGISHSKNKQAIMAAYYNSMTKALHKDDKEAIQGLYGRGQSTVETDNGMTSAPPTTTTVSNGSTSSMTTKKNWSVIASILMMLPSTQL